ncbi:ATP-binding protein [Streptomyces sp. NPDC004959]|uniref:ATP-binding protein n=1 Tax=unclassified Streptomyces TaxID=2593676 RepID=UPI00056D0F37|nr:ATP-binding protein [Streptomyces sp. NRRL F-5630]
MPQRETLINHHPVGASGVGPPAYHEILPRTEDSAEAARRLVRHALTAWGCRPLTGPATLIVSELVANAVTHACGEVVRVAVTRLDGGIEIAVSDSSRALPLRRAPAPDALTGRGLHLVAAFSWRWGTEPKPWGKRVWAEVRG